MEGLGRLKGVQRLPSESQQQQQRLYPNCTNRKSPILKAPVQLETARVRGRGFRQETVSREIFVMKKGGELFPGETQGLCPRARVSQRIGLSHGVQLQVAFMMGLWQQSCGHDVATCCNFGVSFLCMFCCSQLGIRHLELWGFQGWRKIPPPGVFSLDKIVPG